MIKRTDVNTAVRSDGSGRLDITCGAVTPPEAAD
jgi:hypothetical protein